MQKNETEIQDAEQETMRRRVEDAVQYLNGVIDSYERGVASWKEKEIAKRALRLLEPRRERAGAASI